MLAVVVNVNVNVAMLPCNRRVTDRTIDLLRKNFHPNKPEGEWSLRLSAGSSGRKRCDTVLVVTPGLSSERHKVLQVHQFFFLPMICVP